MSQLTNNERCILNKANENKVNFKRMIKIFRKVFESLCLDCRKKVFTIVGRKKESRSDILKNLDTYCEKCRVKVKSILEK